MPHPLLLPSLLKDGDVRRVIGRLRSDSLFAQAAILEPLQSSEPAVAIFALFVSEILRYVKNAGIKKALEPKILMDAFEDKQIHEVIVRATRAFARNEDGQVQHVKDMLRLGIFREDDQETLGDLPSFGPYKRYITLLGRAEKMAPSTSAKSKERASLQKSASTVIYDGGFTPAANGAPVIETIAQPIEIFYPPFGRLVKLLQDPTFQPDPESLDHVYSLMSAAGAITNEKNFAESLNDKLASLLQEYIARVLTSSGCNSDGLIFKQIGNALVPLLVIELKRAIGEGGCDPLVQAEYSTLKRWCEKELTPFREKCPCPTLILAGGGPNLALLGVVWADRFIVQRLTDIVFFAQASTSVDQQLYNLARLFAVIRLHVTELSEYYTDAHARTPAPLSPNAPHPRFFPHPTQFLCREVKQMVKFKFISAVDDMDPMNLTYAAVTEEQTPRSLIVKFADRYGHEVHDRLAKEGCAPKLYYCGLLDGDKDVRQHRDAEGEIRAAVGGLYKGPLRMIVMERLEGENAAIPREEWPDSTYEDIKSVLEYLHKGGYVFGDLRPPNVVFSPSTSADGSLVSAKLVDFDWSGKEGDVFYPPGLSTRVKWADGVKSFQKIEKKHDIDMLEIHFGSA